MADLSKITLPDNTTVNLRDATVDGRRWVAITQGQKWSRLYFASPTNSTVGTSGFLNVTCTRGSVVVNATFLLTSSHAGTKFANCQEISSNNYTQVKSRLVANNSGQYYFEVYDTAASIASGTTQTWNCYYLPLAATTLTPYTVFTDGTTIPSGYTAMNEFVTTVAEGAAPIKSISRSGTTFTATRTDGSTFTFTQQDNNTTYSLTQDSSDGHKITLTPSSGTAQTVTIPDNNTTYTFANGTNGFTVTPSGGTAQTVTVTPSITNNITGSGTSGYLTKFNGTNTITNGPQLGSGTTTYLRNDGSWATPANTTYTLGTSGNNVTLTPAGGTAQSITVPYATSAGSATDSTKLPLAGGAMTGSITFNKVANAISYTGTKATYPMIKFKDNTNDNYGNGIVIGGGGLVVIGGGESSDSVAATHTSGGDEVLDLCSDGAVYIWTNVQNGATSADVKKFTFDTAGSLTATKFIGPLQGNADTATSASGISQSTKIETADALNAFMGTTLRYAQCSANLVGSNTDGLIVSVPWSSKYGQQLYLDDNGYAMAHRYASNSSWSDWKVILDANNYSSYALPLTGGTVTGITKFKGSAASQILQSRNLVGLNTDATAQDSLYLQYNNNTSDTVFFGATAGGSISSNGTQYSGNAATATKLGTANVGTATKPIYLSAGTATACTYSLGASTNGGTVNQLAYYSGANAISSSSALYYTSVNSTATTPATRTILGVYGATYGNTAANMISGTAGLFSYGDGGPQIDFNAGVSGTQAGALIFTDHDSAATGASWHFVSNQTDWNVTSKRFHARTGISVGTNLPTTTHNLYVNGTGSVTTSLISPILGVNASNGTSGGISLYNGAGSIDTYGIAFRYTTNQGKHGYVQGDWATYLTMSNNNGRGWVFKRSSVGGVASISTDGDAVFNGSVTIGGNTTNTSGARLVYSASEQAINFEFL